MLARPQMAQETAATDALAAGTVAAPLRSSPNVLMICGLFTLPYRVLRCVAAAGGRVFVLGNEGAAGFRFSRFCAGFERLDRPLDGTFDRTLAARIDACAAKYDIDMVLAGDQPSARSLAGMKDWLLVPCFPMPDLATFDLLNDKWEFFKLCTRLGILCPPTTLLADIQALKNELAAGTLALPLIAKPLSLDGNRGVVPLTGPDVDAALEGIRYEPVLVQDFIEGIDIGASAYCDHGEIRAFVLHRLARATYSTFSNDVVYDAIARIARETSYCGVFNFDMRLTADNVVYFLECNARFFYKMDLSMLAGVNFAAYGLRADLPRTVVTDTRVRLPKAFLAALPTPWRLTGRDIAALAHLYIDPVSYIREKLHIDWEDRSY